MDAFSIALSIGVNDLSCFKRILIPLIIGIMHFIMPLSGLVLGNQLFYIFNINPKIIVSLVLFYLALMMFLDRKKEHSTKVTSILSIFLLAFSVSLDSFSIGIGLPGLTDKYFLAFLTFSLCSGCITYMGLILGKYSVKLLKEKAIYLGIGILLLIAIVNFCQVLF